MEALHLLFLAVLPALAIIAGLKDLTSMRIPNWISGLLILCFFPAAFLLGLSPMAVAVHVGLAVLALMIGAGLFALRLIGGGDAKLIAAACLWLGVSGAGTFVLWTAVMGGLLSLVLILARRHAQPYLAGAPGWVTQLMAPRGDVPYGVAIAAGTLLAYPASPLMTAFLAA